MAGQQAVTSSGPQAGSASGTPWPNRTTQQWLRSGVYSAVTFLVALGVLAAWIIARADNATSMLINHSSPALIQASYLENSLLDQESGVRGYGLTAQTDFLEPYRSGVDAEGAAVAQLRTLLAGNADRLADLDDVVRSAQTWQGQFALPVADAAPGEVKSVAAERATQGKSLFDAIRSAMTGQRDRLLADRTAARDVRNHVNALRTWVFAAIIALLAILVGLVFEGLRRGVTGPLGRLSADVRQVADGDLGHLVEPTGPADLRALAEDVEAMRLRLLSELAAVDESRLLLDAQAMELQRSNAELEQFAYVASHDLQEPLRKVASFCQLLQRRYAGQLDERADQYIEYAVDGATRMQALIQDLLAFSRVGRVQEWRTVDLEDVCAQALDALSVSAEEGGAEVTHDPLPSVDGEPTQLGMLFQNLLGNAIKFRDPERPVRVHVSAVRDGDRWELAVSDNGIGIAPEFADRVFTIFQRLHAKDAYPGNGIGLAVCKKIVEFHGGEILIDRDHAPGTRIVFTLPAAATPAVEEDGSESAPSNASEPSGTSESPTSAPSDPAAPSAEELRELTS